MHINSSHTDSSAMSQSSDASDKLARGLGWFSIGLGLYKTLSPYSLTRHLGVEGKETLVRLCGAREILSGIGALSDNPTPAIWSRVGGDALDLAALATVMRDDHNYKKENVGLAMGLLVATTAVDLYCAQALNKRHAYQAGPTPDYSTRSGFPHGLEQARGAARDFNVPADMKAALPSPASSPGARTTSTSSNTIR